MHRFFRGLAATVLGTALTIAPSFAQVENPHVWLIQDGSKREIPAATAQITKAQMNGMSRGNVGSSMLKELATTALTIATGPIGALASPMLNLFGHHHPARPSMQMVIALSGQHSENALTTTTPSFEVDYADIPGVDPDVYTPVLLKLESTKDNWRLLGVSESTDPSAMSSIMTGGVVPSTGSHEAPKIDEDRVAAATVQLSSSGHAQITLQHPLDPGEYAVVLRPVANAKGDLSQSLFLTAWDFAVQK